MAHRKGAKKKRASRYHGWVFTVQSWDEDDVAMVGDLYESDHNCQYLIIGWEVAPRTGKQHLQCYVRYREPVTFRTMQERLPGIHIMPQKANKHVEAYCYCMEDGDWCEFGERPRQGHRTDLEVIKHDFLDKKKPIEQVADAYFSQWCQYRRSFDEYIRMKSLDRKFDTIAFMYDPYNSKHWEYIYKYKTGYTHVIEFTEGFSPCIYQAYHSKKHDLLFIPETEGIRERLNIPWEEIPDTVDNGDL